MITDFTADALTPGGYEAKDYTRRLALQIVRDHSTFLWSDTTGLRCDWMEFAALNAPTLQILLDEGALSPSREARFIGVDIDPTVIDACRAHYGVDAPAEWYTATVETLLQQRGNFERTGVLVFDSEYGTWGGKMNRWLTPVMDFAKRQRHTLGEFLLVINVADPERFSDIDKYAATLSQMAGVTITREDFHRYTSRVDPMMWIAIRFGF